MVEQTVLGTVRYILEHVTLTKVVTGGWIVSVSPQCWPLTLLLRPPIQGRVVKHRSHWATTVHYMATLKFADVDPGCQSAAEL